MKRAVPHKGHQPYLEEHMGSPQVFVENLGYHFFPAAAVMQTLRPILADIFLVQGTDQRRDPGGSMNSISDVRDRDFVDCLSRPQPLPESPRDFAMFSAYAVGRAAHPN